LLSRLATANVHSARRLIQSKGLYGPISVDHLRGNILPYVDNLVRALVVSGAGSIPRDELMRVLCPGGVAVIDGKLTIKPWPKAMAQWPQHYDTPDNNAVAFDSVVGPPRYFRWIAEPEWQRAQRGLCAQGLAGMRRPKERSTAVADDGGKGAVV